ncbi:uncharacterized protein LOC117570543 isoform X4 [Drosophila albomicans]|uniref:Uncharacterized protein LOC117570543 isoform X4 n=1 Tax=Drosophila albomicans TaxID=7291 RepID=A0A6P8WWS1_DROAB|nr:uncharacterized protein LOC117570543 isoform X4 [Drosophila albomicans]
MVKHCCVLLKQRRATSIAAALLAMILHPTHRLAHGMRRHHRRISHHPATTAGCRSMMRLVAQLRIRCTSAIIRRRIRASYHQLIHKHRNRTNNRTSNRINNRSSHHSSSQLNPLGMVFQRHQISNHSSHNSPAMEHKAGMVAMLSRHHMRPLVVQLVVHLMAVVYRPKFMEAALLLPMEATIPIYPVVSCSPACSQQAIRDSSQMAIQAVCHHSSNQVAIHHSNNLVAIHHSNSQQLLALLPMPLAVRHPPTLWDSACHLECKLQKLLYRKTAKPRTSSTQYYYYPNRYPVARTLCFIPIPVIYP